MKRNYGKRLLGILLVCVVVFSLGAQVVGAAEQAEVVVTEPTPTPIPIETNEISGWPQGPEVSSLTACLMDADTGAILYNKNMTEKMYPASTTKIMTALIALENSSLEEVVTFTETGVAEAYSGSSNLITQVGEQFTMRDCLYALLLKSANDFASQIAEHVGGSVENFIQMMNDKAAQLGCVNTHFNNAHGMPDENHYTCAYDLALIMQEVSKYELYCEISGTEIYTIPATHLTGARTFDNHNALIKKDHVRYYEGVIAGKTGYTDASRNTFVSIAERNGMRLIEATMSSPVSDESFINAHILYDYGFSNFRNLDIQNNKDAYLGGKATLPIGVDADHIEIEPGEVIDSSVGSFANETYTYNGHVVGLATVSTEYVAQLEAEESARQQEELAAEMKAQQERDAARQKQAFDSNLQMIYNVIIVALLALIVLGLILILISAIVKSRRMKKKRMK